MEIIIDDEFKPFLHKLTPEEKSGLEKSCLEEGIRDALIIWKGHNILLDGHNRYEIAQRHELEFNVIELEFENRVAAATWIYLNQKNRRNWTRYVEGSAAFDLFAFELEEEARANLSTAGKSSAPGKPCLNSDKVSNSMDVLQRIADFTEIGRDTISKIKKIRLKADDEIKAQLANRRSKLSIHKAYQNIRREEKEQEREQARQLNISLIDETPEADVITGKFSTILMDPPWDWGDEGDIDQLGRAKPTYGTMSIDEIESLPIPDFSDENCHLYLWITNRSLPKGFRLFESWGFRYITAITWCKPSFGMGNYFRGSTEHLLFGVKGSLPLNRKDIGTWFTAKRGERHSQKPVESYELIESCSPGPYLELFARETRENWHKWGAEVSNGTIQL